MTVLNIHTTCYTIHNTAIHTAVSGVIQPGPGFLLFPWLG